MSESSIPFSGGTALAEPPAPQLPDPSDDGNNRTKLLALAGGAVVLVLAVAAYFLLFAGGSSDEPASAPVPKGVVPSAAAPTPAAVTPSKQHINAKSFGRDPFKAVIVEATAAPAADSSQTSSATSDTSAATTDTAGSSTASTTGTATPVVTSDHTFRVVGVSSNGKLITVRVDGKSYSGLKAGDVFATYFKVVVIGGKVNGFQFGDEKFSVFGTKKLFIAA